MIPNANKVQIKTIFDLEYLIGKPQKKEIETFETILVISFILAVPPHSTRASIIKTALPFSSWCQVDK